MPSRDVDADSSWLEGLSTHPIFIPTQSGTQQPSIVAQHRMCVRDSDIIVAVGNEIRMMPLSKSSLRKDARPLHYKVVS